MKVVSLFSGCGGLDRGFHEHPSFEVTLAVDAMPAAVETYNANNSGNLAVCQDVRDAVLDYRPDVIIGGPPCQDFSPAGGRVLGDRANLTTTFCDFIVRHRPRFFVLENVPAIRRTAILERATTQFRRAGYGLTARVVRMSDYGVPQNRRRYILIGLLGGNDDAFAGPLDAEKTPVQSMADYDGFIPDLTRPFVYRHARSYARRAVFGIDELYPTVRDCLRRMPPTYRFHRGDRTKNRGEVCDPTVPMIAAIQTFPRDWVWGRRATTLIANAVPPAFSRVLARLIDAAAHTPTPRS
jgi:DNA (cytosine-5)-methyltransferase 1